MTVGLVVEILGDASKLASTLDKSEGQVSSWSSGIAGSAVKVAALAGAAGIAVGAIASMTEAAAADRDEQAKLEQVLKTAGAATGDYTAKVDAAIAAGQDRAFTDSQTRDALASLVTATGDLDTATQSLSAAQDIARFANVDLAVAADAVAKAQAGQDGALRKLMPGLEKGATSTDTLAAATARASGQADLYANSAAGMSDRSSDAFGELTETIGSVFLPVLDAILPALLPILRAFGQLVSALLPVLVPLLTLLGKALGVVASVLSTVVGWLAKLVSWIADAIGAVGRFLDSINPLKGFKMPSLPFIGGNAAPMSAAPRVGRSAASQSVSSSSSAGAPSIVVYTTGDGIEAEQAIVRALRRTARLNGGVVPAVGWTGAG